MPEKFDVPSTTRATNANMRTQVVGQLADTLADGNSGIVQKLLDIASAITASIIGGSTGSTDNAVLVAKGAGGRALQANPFLTSPVTSSALTFAGTSSGAVTVQPQTAAGTYNFNLPTGAGSTGQPLRSQGGGATAMAFSGAVNLYDDDLQRANFIDYSETVNPLGSAGGTRTMDYTLGQVVTLTVSTSANTFAVTNLPASGREASLTLYITNGGSQTVNWMSGTMWAGGTPPTLTTSGLDVIVVTTHDAGATWYGFVSGQNMS